MKNEITRYRALHHRGAPRKELAVNGFPRWMLAILAVGALMGGAAVAVVAAPLPEPIVAERLGVSAVEIQEIALPASPAGPFRAVVVLGGVPYTLELHPHAIRADGFRFLVQRQLGNLEETPAPAPRTLRGTVTGIRGSMVAGSLLDTGLNAWIYFPETGQSWDVQPLAEVDPEAPRGFHAIYRSADILPGDWACGVDGSFGRGGSPSPENGMAVTGMTEAEIGVDSDFEFYVNNGLNVETALFDMENILNRVEAIYETHAPISITYELSTAIVRTVPGDYVSDEPITMLEEFTEKWNLLMGHIPRDVAHLLSGKPSGVIIGVAWVATVCDLANAYSITLSKFSTNTNLRTSLSAHELGHNWSANHCDGIADCGIMCSAINACASQPLHFCAQDESSIGGHRGGAGCLNEEIAPLAVPFTDRFAAPALDPEKWTHNHGGLITGGAVAEPSEPFSLALSSSNGTVFPFEETRSNFVQAASLPGDVTVSYWTQHRGVEQGEILFVEYWNNNLAWKPIDQIESDGVDQDAFTFWSHTLPADAKHDQLRIRFRTEVNETNDIWYVDDVSVPAGSIVGVDDGPRRPLALVQSVPNPFRGSSTIRFHLAEPAAVDLSVYDAVGRRVRNLLAGRQEAGAREMVWDGRDDAGQSVREGVYFCRLEVAGRTMSRKMHLIR
jgi:reprolysin-like metallo-peptidase family M12B/flagellar hook capping protein FlgD